MKEMVGCVLALRPEVVGPGEVQQPVHPCIVTHSTPLHGVARCGESNPLVRLEPCLCMVLWQINSACVAGVHTPAKPVCGMHVAGTVVL